GRLGQQLRRANGTDDGQDFRIAGQLPQGGRRLAGLPVGVLDDQLDELAVDAAGGVDLVGRDPDAVQRRNAVLGGRALQNQGQANLVGTLGKGGPVHREQSHEGNNHKYHNSAISGPYNRTHNDNLPCRNWANLTVASARHGSSTAQLAAAAKSALRKPEPAGARAAPLLSIRSLDPSPGPGAVEPGARRTDPTAAGYRQGL